MNSKQLYLRLLVYVRPYWKMLAASIMLLALLAATEPLFPALIKPLLDEGFTNKEQSFIRWAPLFIIGIFTLKGILSFSSSYASNWVATHVVMDIRNEMFQQLIHLPTSFFDNHSSGSLTSKIAYDVNNVTGAATHVLTTIVRDSLTIIALLSWLLWLDWKLTSITFFLTPFFMLVMRYFNKRMRYLSRENQYSMANLTHLIEQASSSHKVIKMFLGADYENNRFNKANARQRGFAIRSGIASAAVVPITQILTSFSVAAIIALALNGTNASTATAGGFMSFLTALLMLLAPLKRIADINPTLQRGLAAAESAFEILDEAKEIDQGTESLLSLSENISFNNISFSYIESKQKILHNINLQINRGSTVALVGRSGSGKTTLINLLTRFYEPNQGSIKIGEIGIQQLTLNDLRKQISLVSQDVRLFDDTISANVAYGVINPEKQAVIEALKSAYAWEFVKKQPDGIETLIGQDGAKLSGGQRQRIAIARAFYKNSPILILDEATSALDTESERQIQLALEKLMINKTTIVIAHRLSTIENADEIIVMDEGAIKEKGSHKELISKNGLYSHYHQLQFSDI
ncbi:MAG: lipid A export permease/ATP-binding protein MsbA [Candidatus Marinimicrobia bacterium]|nr:lipid A export permease/ATP-binding protein MsbA [Candidatus Neomarinimicrobiota bacterium]